VLGLGQIILIGTDGIWEMRNEQGEMFGKERLKKILRKNNSLSAAEIVMIIDDALGTFRGTAQFEDDITLVVIRVES
jgi:sigma-B regulation protein RsbU (phosphoserine phosphatase)